MSSATAPQRMSSRVRERWARQLAGALEDLDAPLREFLARPAPTGVDSMAWMEASLDWQAKGADWVLRSRNRLLNGRSASGVGDGQILTLLADEAVDDQIAAGRLAVAVMESAQGEFNDLRLRLQHLDRVGELARNDRLLASVWCEDLLQAWLDSGQTRTAWHACQPLLRRFLADAHTAACHQANAFLLENGVLPEINLRDLIRRPSPGAQRALASLNAPPAPAPAAAPTPAAPGRLAQWTQAAAEVGVRLRQLFTDRLPAAAPDAPATALDARTAYALTHAMEALTQMTDWSSLEEGVVALKRQTRALKAGAGSDRDKAVIEVVALIFDSILAEERIPPSVRVWFARLQMPVLRVAVVDADFLGDLDHPARRLIDRLGSCVLGFDSRVPLAPLEAEIKRIVQVIEQYPETGRRVFEMVYSEFQTFLAGHLVGREGVERVVSIAQQVEQKETLTVKFTIELRKLLGDAPVREAVREFLLHDWAEVLAVASVRFGPQHAESAQLRQAAADVLWLASAKPSRQERAQVITRLPAVLARLRSGLALLGLGPEAQEAHLERLNEALAEAFLSRSDPLSQEWLANMTRHLARLEDFLDDSEPDALALDQDNIEWITGVDASRITVVPDTDLAPLPALKAWAAALPPGAWFELEHQGRPAAVQLAWKSQRQQLYLFVGADQACYLLQQGRVAQYLDSGLLKPCEGESLTVRATRDALDKLDANPERLLA